MSYGDIEWDDQKDPEPPYDPPEDPEPPNDPPDDWEYPWDEGDIPGKWDDDNYWDEGGEG